ncbi:hypothetical protein [Alkalihalobacterium sp. APHAB7]|uniref:hypothetical protein n=1 Tax=Alkalihalobacterium sp. APHAB7 TaxID=3402081 RepID=UPI003AB0778E
MSLMQWILLIVYVLIPTTIIFAIIFGTWRLIAFLVEKFRKFTRKMDGIDT